MSRIQIPYPMEVYLSLLEKNSPNLVPVQDPEAVEKLEAIKPFEHITGWKWYKHVDQEGEKLLFVPLNVEGQLRTFPLQVPNDTFFEWYEERMLFPWNSDNRRIWCTPFTEAMEEAPEDLSEPEPGYEWYYSGDVMFLSGFSELVQLDCENRKVGARRILSIH